MSEAAVQAFIRLGVVVVTTALSALLVNVSAVVDLIPDLTTRGLVGAIVAASINALLKYLGGATTLAVEPTDFGTRAATGTKASRIKRPSIFSI